MHITKVSIRNYRSIQDLDLEIDDYSVLIGANGAGKSSVLYALDWFFNGGDIGAEDVHGGIAVEAPPEFGGGSAGDVDEREVAVEVTFGGLNGADRQGLGRYGRGPIARFRRSWVAATGTEKIVGNARQGPGFADVRGADGAPAAKKAYKQLQEARPDLGLPDATTKGAIFQALEAWEEDAANGDLLEPIESGDATHMFGVQGEHRLEQRIRYVLIPAAADIATQVGGTGRGSTLSRLVGGLVTTAVAEARDTWSAQHGSVLDDLTQAISSSVSAATDSHATRVNERLAALLPTATISIHPQMPDWTPKIDPSLSTSVALDGRDHDVSRQGHGVQRAVMIAMLQALAPTAASATPDVTSSPTPIDTSSTPTFVVAIEEPEIYQHPVRARHLARALWDLSQTAPHQVLLATHSPYFIRPEQFAGLRRISLVEGRSTSVRTTAALVASGCGADEPAVQRRLAKELPRTFSEGFFADVAVLVEGDTDKVVLETLAERFGTPLDSANVAVLAVGGKSGLRLAAELLEQLGTRTYVLLDGDSLGAKRKHPDDPAKQQRAHASHRAGTERTIAWLSQRLTEAVDGAAPCVFGGPSVATGAFCVLHDDLEHELESWAAYQDELAALRVSPRAKDISAYRSATAAADLQGVPAIFKVAIEAMIDRKQAC